MREGREEGRGRGTGRDKKDRTDRMKQRIYIQQEVRVRVREKGP